MDDKLLNLAHAESSWLLESLRAGNESVFGQGKNVLGDYPPKLVRLILSHRRLAMAADIKVQIKVLDASEDSSNGRSPAAVGVQLEVCSTSGIEKIRLRLSYSYPTGKQMSRLSLLGYLYLYFLDLLTQNNPGCQMWARLPEDYIVVPLQKRKIRNIQDAVDSL